MRVVYGRVSTKQQTDTGALESQERQLLAKAEADEVILDVGSGKTTARPGYQRLLELIGSGQVTQLLVPDQDRLNRNVQADLELWALCDANGTKITDLQGREIEFKTPDGELLGTVISALNQHRSRAYGLKTQRALEEARAQGYPARPRVPFGLMKVRDQNGRFVAIDLDPITAPLARQRIDWFLKDGMSLTKLCAHIAKKQPAHTMQMRQLRRWLESPLLTGRLAWHRDKHGHFTQVATEQTFQPLISDAEHEAIKIRLAAASTLQGLRGRELRMFSGLVKCADCGVTMGYKISGVNTTYLRCCNPICARKNKMIRADQVFQTLQFSLSEHAKALVPILQRPAVDPPEVIALLSAISDDEQRLSTAPAIRRPSLEAGIEQMRAEVQRLRSTDTSTPAWLLIGALRSPMLWLKPDDWLNRFLRLVLERVTVQLGDTVAAATVTEVRCRTVPALAPLPADQNNIVMRRGLADLALLLDQERLEEAISVLG